MKEENSNLNLNEVRDLINKVKYKEKNMACEYELYQLRMDGNDVIQLAKTSVSLNESLRCANLVNQRVQESQKHVKEKVEELTVKNVKKANHIRNNIKCCGKSRLKPLKEIPKNELRKTLPHNEKNTLPPKQLSNPLQFVKKNTHFAPLPFPKLTQSFLKDDLNLKSTKDDKCVLGGNLVVLGVHKKLSSCKVDSVATNSMKPPPSSMNAAVQTLFEKNSRNFGVQVGVNPNFKLIQIKPKKYCEIQVLPSINIQPTPSSNFRLEEVVERDRTQMSSMQIGEEKDFAENVETEINYGLTDDDLLNMTLKSQTVVENSTSESMNNFTFSKDVPVIINENLDNETGVLKPISSVKHSPVASNAEDETCVSHESITFENPSIANVGFLSAGESKMNRSVPCVVKEVAIQTSELTRSSVSSWTKSLSSSLSCPDISGLSFGEVIIKSARKNNDKISAENSSSTTYILSEGEVLPQNLCLIDKLGKSEKIILSHNHSIGEIR